MVRKKSYLQFVTRHFGWLLCQLYFFLHTNIHHHPVHAYSAAPYIHWRNMQKTTIGREKKTPVQSSYSITKLQFIIIKHLCICEGRFSTFYACISNTWMHFVHGGAKYRFMNKFYTEITFNAGNWARRQAFLLICCTCSAYFNETIMFIYQTDFVFSFVFWPVTSTLRIFLHSFALNWVWN